MLLSRLAASGRIRTRGEAGQRRYLKRDIHRYNASVIHRDRRRALSGAPDGLTNGAKMHHKRRVTKAKIDLPTRIAKFVETAGSYAAASRKLDIPKTTLQRAAKGGKIQKGTELLIENQLAQAGE